MRTALTLCAFISTASRRIVSSVTARPRSGSHSWRLTPRSMMRRPLTRSSPPATSTVRKPILQRDRLALRPQLGVVEARVLGAPGDGGGGDGLPRRGVDAELGDDDARGDVGVDAEGSVVRGVHEHVADGRREQRHRAEDPGQPPHVLVLQVAALGELAHAHREHVLAVAAQGLGDVELVAEPAAGRLAQLDAVEPRAQVGVDAVEAQDGAAGRPSGRELEAGAVVPGRVRVRDVRRVDRERVRDVRVRGRAVAVQLPVRRDREPVPAAVVERGVGERPRPWAATGRAGTPSRRRAGGRAHRSGTTRGAAGGRFAHPRCVRVGGAGERQRRWVGSRGSAEWHLGPGMRDPGITRRSSDTCVP